jgi:hypothetical protein
MSALQALTITVSLGLLSCNNRTETTVKSENAEVNSISIDTTLKPEKQTTAVISDTIKRLVVDDYPLTNEMLADKSSNNSSYKKQSGQTYSYDKAWFSNDTLKQTLVFQLYTDYHRVETYHFYSNDIPSDLINRMDLHIDGGELASEKQKFKEFSGFLKQTNKINSTYFITDKGLKLGASKEKVLKIYGIPDKQTITKGIEKLEWEFVGDILYNGKTDLKGKPLAKDSYGHQAILFFRKDKLIGQILHNDIP